MLGIFHSIKVSATLNYLQDKEHVLTHCLPENFGDRLNTSDFERRKCLHT